MVPLKIQDIIFSENIKNCWEVWYSSTLTMSFYCPTPISLSIRLELLLKSFKSGFHATSNSKHNTN